MVPRHKRLDGSSDGFLGLSKRKEPSEKAALFYTYSMSYECKYPPHLQKYLDSGDFDEHWSRTLRNFFLDRVIKSYVKGLSVVETGSRSGVFTYAAHYHGAKKALGVEFMSDFSQKSSKALEKIPSCNVIHGDSRRFDHSKFDMVLCLGLLYNSTDEDKEIILKQVSKCKFVLAEFWTNNNDKLYPFSETVVHPNNTIQYLTNNVKSVEMLSSYFYHVEDITPRKHIAGDLQNRYYICRQKEACLFL